MFGTAAKKFLSNIERYIQSQINFETCRIPAISNNFGHSHRRNVCTEQAEAYSYEKVREISDFLKRKTKYRPTVGLILGSGISGFTTSLKGVKEFPYEDISGFPVSSVSGHAGKLAFGDLNGVETICMMGRFHNYEGIPMWKCILPVRVMKLLGVKTLIVTNAAGGLNPDFNVGDLMLIKDHINFPAFAGNNPLRGQNDERWGPRFPGMNNPYDLKLRDLTKEIAAEMNLGDITREGIYAMYGGPSYETVAECRAIRELGADAVGMSTAPEIVTAKHCGMATLGISLICNKCIMEFDTEAPAACHEHVLDAGHMRNPDLIALLVKVVERLK